MIICDYNSRKVFYMPVPVTARFKAHVCGRSLAGIVSSNSAGGIVVCLLCVVSYRSLCRAGHSSRGVTLSVVWPMSVIAKPRKGRS